jgi:hypothetical protein
VQAIVAITAPEAEFFEGCVGDCPVLTIRPVVPWTKLTTRAFDDRHGVVFAAGWLAGAESPNADGLRWFADNVWPTIVAAVPGVQLTVTGDAPPEIRAAMAGRSIVFSGLLPDLHATYESARVAIVPLRYGAGVSIKGFEALKSGVPVVTTRAGGADLDRVAPGAVWTVDTAGEFTKALAAVLTDRDEWNVRHAAIQAASHRWTDSSCAQWRALLDDAQLARVPAMARGTAPVAMDREVCP